MEMERKNAKQGLRMEERTVEVGGDFTLPDYLPEIRRILRAEATCAPMGEYFKDGRGEYAGSVSFTLIYQDGEGVVTAVPLDGDYGFAIEDAGKGTPLSREDRVVGVSCRPKAPRRVALKAKVQSRVSLAVEEGLPDVRALLPAGFAPEEAEVLLGRGHTRVLSAGDTGERTAELSLCAEGTEPLRVLWCRGRVRRQTGAVAQGAARLSGEVEVTVFVTAGGLPFPLVGSVPFSEEISVKDGEAGDSLLWDGTVHSVEITPSETEEGTELFVEVAYSLWCTVGGDRPITYVQDLYGTRRPLKAERTELSLSAFSEILTATSPATLKRRAEGEEKECVAVLDAVARAVDVQVTPARGGVTVTGEWEVDAILASHEEGRLFPARGCVPFAVELPHGEGRSLSVDRVLTSPLDVSVTVDGGELSFSVETECRAAVCRRETVKAVSSVSVGDGFEDDGSFAVYYPEAGDTLWQVAKAYGVSLDALEKMGGIHAGEGMADHPKSLDGVSFLCIPPKGLANGEEA